MSLLAIACTLMNVKNNVQCRGYSALRAGVVSLRYIIWSVCFLLLIIIIICIHLNYSLTGEIGWHWTTPVRPVYMALTLALWRWTATHWTYTSSKWLLTCCGMNATRDSWIQLSQNPPVAIKKKPIFWPILVEKIQAPPPRTLPSPIHK